MQPGLVKNLLKLNTSQTCSNQRGLAFDTMECDDKRDGGGGGRGDWKQVHSAC